MTYDDSNGNGSSQLPVSRDEILQNMKVAVPAQRRGGNQYVRLCPKTGARTFGRDDLPLPDYDFAIQWREILWGFKEFRGATVVNAVMRPIAAGPRPMPAGDFAPYGTDGARACMELKLCAMQEPGFVVSYSCLNDSGSARILDCWGEIAAQYQVNPAFANPVVRLKSDHFTNQYGTTFCLAYEVRDWLADDGTTLLSTVEGRPKGGGGAPAAAAELPF